MRRYQAALQILACIFASTVPAAANPDAQGWNGPGWYITGAAPPTSQPVAAPNYILFEGPHNLPGECLEVYDRFYSPIGICRFLKEKPVRPARLKPEVERGGLGRGFADN